MAADQAKAAAISAQIQAAGLLLAKYAERADAESVRAGQLDVRLRLTRSASTLANMDLVNARRLLVDQAIAAYTEGGAFSYAPGTVQGSGLVVASAYAEAVAEHQQMALSDYRHALTKDTALFSELSEQRASVRAATRQLSADRAAASRQQTSLRVTLSGVKGDLALAVADVEKQQAAVQAAEEKALLESIRQLPRTTPVMAADRSPSVGPGGAGGAGNGPGGSGPASASTQSSTTAAPTSTVTSATEAEVPLAAVTTSVAPTTADPAPASTTTSALVTTSGSTTTLPPSTTATTSVAFAPSASSAPAATPTSAALTTVSSTSTSSTPATTIPSTTTSLAASTSASATTTAPVSLTTTTLDAAGDPAGDTLATSAASTTASASTTTSTSVSTTTTAPVTSTTASGGADSYLPASGWQVALDFAESQIGKPYQWGGAGPAAYDCSGLTMVAWGKAGLLMPHSAQDQYDMTTRVPISELQPGDLVFFGTPTDVYHVGLYVGGGNMVAAPETGQDVMIQPIYELNLLGGGRP